MQRYTFNKRERLTHKETFSYLFEHGFSFRVGVLKVFYVFDPPADLLTSKLSVAVTAPKRMFKRAYDRNFLKRRMREAFRLHKHLLLPTLIQQDKNLVVLIKYNTRDKVDYTRIEKSTIKAFDKLVQFSENPQLPPRRAR